MSKNKAIIEFKKQVAEVVESLGTIEDLQLTEEEIKTIVDTYDRLTIHGSISIEQIQD